MQKISYVIPCYRSAHTLEAVVAEITATMAGLARYDYEVVLVNDCSPDDTIGTIRRLVAADPHVQGVDLAKNFGQHAALMAGFHQCSGDIIVCLDDDGQTPADEVGKLLDKIEAAAARLGLTQEILMEINIGAEESKSGVGPDDLWPLLDAAAAKEHIRVRGMMAIPPADADDDQSLRPGTYLRRRSEQSLHLTALYPHGQFRPAGKFCARAALFDEHPVRGGRGGIIRPCSVEEYGRAAEIDFYHLPHPSHYKISLSGRLYYFFLRLQAPKIPAFAGKSGEKHRKQAQNVV